MNELRQILSSEIFSPLDRHFSGFIEALAGGDRPTLALAAALASRQLGDGHICLDLQDFAGAVFPDPPVAGVQPVRLPGLNNWTRELKNAAVVGGPGDFTPFILDAHHRLYLHRFWNYEQTLAAEIARRAAAKPEGWNETALARLMENYFPAEAGREINWQREAARIAVRRNFCVISGGPGTGKTHTLVLILALLLGLSPARKLRIAVAAPTGKAAARIQDSIRRIKATLAGDDAIQSRLPEEATTIHRLLGYVPGSAAFRHHALNPLPFDVVAVDEASMVDLALMAKLFQAVPPGARMILLGDKDQLASVESGAVLGDICAAATGQHSSPVLAGCVVQLKKNHRFGDHSAICRLSHAIIEGRAETVSEIVGDGSNHPAADLVGTQLPRRTELKAALRERVLAGFSDFIRAAEPGAALAALARFRILCALREGDFGVAGLNRLTEEILAAAGLIRPQPPWYPHQPVMVTRNDYNLKLFNGDTGVILPDAASGEPRAFFPGPENTVRSFLPLRLPEHVTAYALTVHKSQGSEFDRVLLVLPDRESPILSRELIYTGITRARQSVELWFDNAVLHAALTRRIIRKSGLAEALVQNVSTEKPRLSVLPSTSHCH